MRLAVLLFAWFAAAAAVAQETGVAEARAAYARGEYATALPALRQAAEAGDPVAQNILGDAYERGHGVAADADQARAWYEKAAQNGSSFALINLGRLAEAEAPERARAYYEAAIAAGNPEGHAFLGAMLRDGLGGPADGAGAAAAFEAGRKAGSARATLALAFMAYEENALAPARALFSEAAALGSAEAMARLAAMYAKGEGGGPADPVAAYALYLQAASLGEAQAMIELGYFLRDAPGFWQDPVMGAAWCLAGAERLGQGEAPCAQLIEYLPPEDEAEARRIAGEI